MNEIEEMCREHFNEPIICHDEVVRLIGYGETAIDYYLICQKMHGEIIWNTAVGGYVFLDRLRGQNYVKSTNGEDWDDLVRLDNILQLNAAPRRDEILIERHPDDFECRQLVGGIETE